MPMDELSCPRCRMTKYRNPLLKLMINVCGHALCEACVEVIFTRESALCPECGRTLKKNGFRTQLFEDTRVDKEVDIRKGVLKIYNKQESDFPTLKEYNDYLEEVEDIIWCLESGRNEKETREKIAQYKQENEALIRRNQIRLNQEKNYFKEQLAREAKDQQQRLQLLNQMDREAQVSRKRDQESLLNDLTNNTTMSPGEVLAMHKKIKLDQENARAKVDGKISLSAFCSDPAVDYVSNQLNETANPHYVHEPLKIDVGGPEVPGRHSFVELGYMKHVRDATTRDVGGGYNSILACERALNDAFGGLFLQPSATAADVA